MSKKILIATTLIGLTALAQPSLAVGQESSSATTKYRFYRKAPTKFVEPYLTTIYSADQNSVRTMRGDELYAGKDTVMSFAVNPSGVNYGIVTKNKKGVTSAQLYHTQTADKKLFKFDTKKYGMPTAIGYTADARGIIVATPGNIYFLNPRTFQSVNVIENVPIRVDLMALSPNGYYLAVAGDEKVVVYNLQENKVRKEYNIGEKINGMAFSPDNSDFGVLTDDGLLTVYNTRTFDMRKIVDDLGDARSFAFNLDGKYVAVVTGNDQVTVINLLRDSDRDYYTADRPGVTDVDFITDAMRNTVMVYPSGNHIEAIRLINLKPYYSKLIEEEAENKMNEWLKMMPGESMEEYQNRVNAESRQRQRRLFEEEAATRFAGDMMSGANLSIGTYDRANGVLALNFDSMPTIYLPVPESEVTSISKASDLVLSDVMYGVLPDDSFEIVYAKVTNLANGESYIYDNVMRADLQFMAADDAISLEVLQQQQMEEIRLQELREKVLREAKSENIISDHTQIAVDSKVVPEYDAAGNRILNYVVSVTYTVDPEFSAEEDFGPGKYHVEESGAATSMLSIVEQAFGGDLKQYMKPGKRMKVVLSGAADATPIIRGIPYDGSYGEFEEEPVYINGDLSALTVTQAGGIKENEQLALMRAMGVKDYLEKHVEGFKDMNADYRYEVNVSEGKGSEYRRISLQLTFEDAY